MPETPAKTRRDMDAWTAKVEAAAVARGTRTREGLAFNEETGELSDAMAWELEGDD
jgi:hypothetical protein